MKIKSVMFGMVFGLGLMISLAAPIMSPEAVSAADQSRFSFAGKGASAGWTTCPEVAPGDVCTDTFMYMAEQRVRENGQKYGNEFLHIDQFTYSFDEEWNFTFLGSRTGEVEVDFSINKKLDNASVSADVPVVECMDTCEDNVVHVDASWTATGPSVKSKSKSHVISDDVKYHSSGSGTFRPASAEAMVDGEDVGTLYWADLFNSKYSEVVITK